MAAPSTRLQANDAVETRRRLVQFVAFASFVAAAGIALFQPSAAMNEDLGRHLLLGELIWNGREIPRTNLLTYTAPDFPFLNHHWLSEVLMHLVARAGGIDSLILVKVLCLGGALAIAVRYATRAGGPIPALATATLFLPLVLERNTERPEMFAYPLFSALSLILFAPAVDERPADLRGTGGGSRNTVKLAAVSAIMGLWVNLHLSFVYGLLLVGIYFAKEVAGTRPERRRIAWASAIACAAVLAVLLNPRGLRGATYPFAVFRNFGYETVENVGVLRLTSILPNDYCIPYFLASALVCAGLIAAAIRKTSRWEWSYLLALGFAALVFAKIRNMPYFLLAAIPAGAAAVGTLWRLDSQAPRISRNLVALLIIIWNGAFSACLLVWAPPALSVPEPGKKGFDYFEVLAPPGNVFNNFDIGSYLEYRLYPRYKAFVDNRPEAFPPEFFAIYRDIQTNPLVRKEKFAAYGINSIVFSRGDITEWARRFLDDMRVDPEWRLVYVDDAVVIYERREFRRVHPR